MIDNGLTKTRDVIIYLFAIMASLIMSFVLNHHYTPLNPDGVCYVLSAATIKTQGLIRAMQLCGQARWPFYPFLIQSVTQFTHLSYVNAAMVLNAFFSALTMVFFIAIIHTLGASRRGLWLAALVILCAHELNNLRVDVIRDHGFWAFYLASIGSLIYFFRKPRLSHALLFNSTLYLATFFRLEGLLFIALLPFVAFMMPGDFFKRVSNFLRLHALNGLVAVFLLTYLVMYPHQIEKLSRLNEIAIQLQHGLSIITTRVVSATQTLQAFLPIDSKHEASFLVSITFVVWYIMNVIVSLSFIYFIIILYAWFKKIRFIAPANHVINAYIVINLLVTLIFLAENLFLSKRYLIALSLTLMLWIPFALDYLYQHHLRKTFGIAITCILLSGLGTFLHWGPSNAYLRQAGDWLAYTMPQQASFYTNDYAVMYYSAHFGINIFTMLQQDQDVKVLANGRWQHYEYLALRVTKHDMSVLTMLNEIKAKPVRVFTNNKGSQVLIYHLNINKQLPA